MIGGQPRRAPAHDPAALTEFVGEAAGIGAVWFESNVHIVEGAGIARPVGGGPGQDSPLLGVSQAVGADPRGDAGFVAVGIGQDPP